MAIKTTENDGDVQAFIAAVEDEKKRQDSQALIDLMRDVMGAEPKMWGDSIVGFGKYRYEYKSGRTDVWFPVGFSPRKANLVLYLMGGYEERTDLLAKLGKHSVGKGCLYVKRLAEVDTSVLRELIAWSKAWAATQDKA